MNEKKVTNQVQRDYYVVKKFTITNTISVAAIGDILLHKDVYESARISLNEFDFKPIFNEVRPILLKPDFLVANQESLPAGGDLGLSSYPRFNSPVEIIRDLQYAGVDFLSTANNHSLDKGEEGVYASIEAFNSYDMPYTGTYLHEEDQKRIRTFSMNSITFATLSYTYGTNGLLTPVGKEYLVNLLDVDKMILEITRAKEELNVDFVIVNLHWGNEYEIHPSNNQVDMAISLTEAGADIIFGHHPHVLQPIYIRNTQDDRKAVIAYSLGNFISGQRGGQKDLGGMISLECHKTQLAGRKSNSIHSVHFYPTYVRKVKGSFTVLPFTEDQHDIPYSFEATMEHVLPSYTE
ncbi:CapA family protein [Bacillus coahuilensis]|nr:CapA family protein [Bacillus coahuilensis]